MQRKHYSSLDRLMESIGSVFDAYSVVLFCRQDAGAYALRAFFSLGNDIAPDQNIAAGQGLVGWIVKNNEPLLVEKFDEKNTFLGYYGSNQGEEIKVFVGCPLPGGLGALCMDSKKTYTFSSKDQRVLSLFAQVVAAILTDMGEVAKSCREQVLYHFLQKVYGLREAQPKWTDFLDSFLSLIAGATEFGYAFLVVSDEWGDNYFLEGSNKPVLPKSSSKQQTFSMGSGLLGWAFKKNQPVFFGDGTSEMMRTPLFEKDVAAPNFKALLVFPLKVHTRCRGVLALGDEESKNITLETRSFAKMAADYLALLLENLYLKNRIKQLGSTGVMESVSIASFSDSTNSDTTT